MLKVKKLTQSESEDDTEFLYTQNLNSLDPNRNI